jgi:hypothetical protein
MGKQTSEKQKEPVFVHSGFRTSSTWLWVRLRSATGLKAYYEPYHSALCNMSVQDAQNYGPRDWQSNHPAFDAYFTEYLSLIQPEGGVPFLAQCMETDRFIPPDGTNGPLPSDEIAYLQALIADAESSGQRPALCFTRSLGRAKAIRTALGGKHVLLHRNLFHQWCSFVEQASKGNTYFLRMVARAILNNQHDPFLCSLSPLVPADDAELVSADFCAAFILFHLYSNGLARDACDLAINSTVIAACSMAREEAERELSALLGTAISLSDAKPSIGLSGLDARDRHEVERLVRCGAKLLLEAEICALRPGFVVTEMELAFLEWDRTIFYTQGPLRFLDEKLHEVQKCAIAHERRLLDEAAQLTARHTQREQSALAAAAEARRIVEYLMTRTLWERLLFKPTGRPKYIIRRALFHSDGRPRAAFKGWTLQADGRPRRAFRLYVTHPSQCEAVSSLPCR